MVVDDLNVKGIVSFPPKANSPLIVDSNAVLSCALSLQSFQSVPRRRSKIGDIVGVVQHPEFPARDALDILRQSAGDLAAPDPLCLGAAEGPDHSKIVPPRVINVKQKEVASWV